MSPECEVCSVEGREQAWRDFVRRVPGASVYHRLEWGEVIRETFGHRLHYRLALEGGELRGVLPLVEMKSRAFGHFLVSLPFLNYGGIAAETTGAAAALAEDAAALAKACGARHVELRQAAPLDVGWRARQHKVVCVVPLAADPEPYWQALSSRLRGKVRKAGRAGAQFSLEGAGGLAEFYQVFARNMRDLGTPVYPRRFFENVFRRLADSVCLFLVRIGSKPVAAAIGVRHGETIELPWICSNYDYSSSYVNEFLYWSAIEWASGQGLRRLDLGRSTAGSGPHQFKRQWRPEEIPLNWYYWAAPGAPLPRLSPDNPKYRLAIRCWQKLPLAVANRLGPAIVRNIP